MGTKKLLRRLVTQEDWKIIRELLDEDDLKQLRVAVLAKTLKDLGWHPAATKLAEKTGLNIKTVRAILSRVGKVISWATPATLLLTELYDFFQ